MSTTPDAWNATSAAERCYQTAALHSSPIACRTQVTSRPQAALFRGYPPFRTLFWRVRPFSIILRSPPRKSGNTRRLSASPRCRRKRVVVRGFSIDQHTFEVLR